MSKRSGIAVLTLAIGFSPFAQTPTSADEPAQKPAVTATKNTEAARLRAQRLNGTDNRQQRDAAVLDQKALDSRPTFESVRPKDATAFVRTIDAAITAKLTEQKIPASPTCTDAEFVRRAYLDIIGRIPTAGAAAAFIDSKDPKKRAKLIDELLASEEFGRHMGDIWSSLMIDKVTDNRRLDVTPMTEWLAERFNQNQPWDKLTYDILTATGPQDESPAVTYFLANLTPDRMTDSACRIFLGVQLQCAQCHNHPFTDWKQEEYWQMAAFFMKVTAQRANNAALRDGAVPGIEEAKQMPRNRRNLPESAMFLDAKFLQGDEPNLGKADPYRPVLAGWLTTAENPYFARAMVNRTWSQFLGRGFVNPIDDMTPENVASHPALLDDLAKLFAADFDVKQLIRGVCNSQTYQRSSKPLPENVSDQKYFSHMSLKVLTPEQLFDSLTSLTGPEGAARLAQNRARPGATPRDRFVDFYLGGADFNPTEYEAGIPQALKLMNSNLVGRPEATVRRLVPANASVADGVTNLYLATLSRRPDGDELRKMAQYVSGGQDKLTAYGDVLWALLNSSEFALNR